MIRNILGRLSRDNLRFESVRPKDFHYDFHSVYTVIDSKDRKG